MGTWPLTDEEITQAIDAIKQFGTQGLAAASMNISRGAFQNRLREGARRGLLGTRPVLPGFHISKTTAVTDADGEVVRQFVQQRPEPGEEFSVPEGHVIKGVSALVNADGRVTQQWVKTKTDSVIPDLTAALKEAFKEHAGGAKLVKPPAQTDADLCSVYPIADQHVGLLAWHKDASEDYDLKIGAKRLRESMALLVAQSPPSKLAIILNLGDWQHTDDQRNMTPRSGNLLDVDSRYFKILQAGVQLMMDCIDLCLQKHDEVIVRNIPGNHDPHASIALTIALGAFYAKNPRVTVEEDPSDFFYHRFGATLIGATHGHKLKPDKMAMSMAVHRREDWGATKYHWFLFGHIHHETAKEVGDVRVESFQTLAAKDAHAHSSGYTSGQSLQSVTLHKHDGEQGRHRVNIAPPHPRKTADSSFKKRD